MVTILTPKDRAAIARVVERAEKHTRAEIIVVITPASDLYLDFVLLYAILLGALATTGLWISHAVTDFPALLAIQLGFILIVSAPAVLRRQFLRFLPIKILNQRCARRAWEEYHAVHRRVPAAAPIVLLFVSLGERYVQIISSHTVYEKLPDAHWETIIRGFTQAIPNGFSAACAAAIEQIGRILEKDFPENGESYSYSNEVIERP